ncbi:TIM barrel protein [Erwinia sp. MMLR14_017]|uniref:TIM barrel protein n=1 Tax=Erwinia sp. MMLR14_017 TaxID=3093842 RepID=UPI002990804A|nr:TIM barrel protein [Erwinia sp. MMLR14_017]MDW8848247.1 TIM barrel protein [Erwinia sp. MMLR14_017]
MYSIANAPCSWGVDDPKNPFLPPWQKVLSEAQQAGYPGIELGPWGYLPTDPAALKQALANHNLSLIAGTIFDDLVSEANFENMRELAHNICANLQKVPVSNAQSELPPPYLVIIDFGDAERARCAGQSARAKRLPEAEWQRMVSHIRALSAIAREYGVRPVIHPHAGGFIEFGDEIDRIAADIPASEAGLCLDTGHLYYAGLDPVSWLRKYAVRLDYLHFKDVNRAVYKAAIAQQQDFFKACAAGVMCPLGTGDIDYPAVRALLAELNWQGWITIEQERDPRDVAGSLKDVTASLHYLRNIGF